MCITICGRFCLDEDVVAGYNNRIHAKHTAKRGCTGCADCRNVFSSIL
ncbi:DUF6783 domain-containing protein [Blautia sp. HCP3S3_H10_1]